MIDRHGEPTGLDTEEWMLRERQELDYAGAAEECGVSADEIEKEHTARSFKLRQLDPLRELRDLIDQLPRRATSA